MSIRPFNNKLIIKPYKITETDSVYKSAIAAGIQLPDEDKRKREQAAVDQGTVVAVGPTVFSDFGCPGTVAVGDEVVFAKYAGKEIVDPDTGETFTAINDEDLVAILKKETK
jgi:co-chaperonin GroES (HSP10)